MDNRSIQQTLARIHSDRPIAAQEPESDLAPEFVKWFRRNKAIMDIALPALGVAFVLVFGIGVVIGYLSKGPQSQVAPIQRNPPISVTNETLVYMQKQHEERMAEFKAQLEKIVANAPDLSGEQMERVFWQLDRQKFEEELNQLLEVEVDRRIKRRMGTSKNGVPAP